MLRHALSELRLHPTRFVATLVAIAISVGFVAAISVFVNSQQSALGKQNALQISKADVVVAIDEYEWPRTARIRWAPSTTCSAPFLGSTPRCVSPPEGSPC